MFQKYKELLERLNCMESDDLTEIKGNIDNIKIQIEELTREIMTLEREASDKNSPHIRALISKEASKIESNYRTKLDLLARRKDNILKSEAEKRKKTIESLDLDKATENALSKVYKIIQKYKDIISIDSVSGLRVPIDTSKDLVNRSKIFTEHYEMLEDEAEPLCNRVAEKISMKNIFQNIENPKVAIGAMTGYIIVGLVSTLYLPMIAISGYVGLTVLSVRDAMRLNKAKFAIEKEFWMLQKSYENLKIMHDGEVERILKEANDKADKELELSIKSTADEEVEIKEDYLKLLEDLKAMENDPNFIATNLSIFKNKLDALKNERKDYEDYLQEYMQELEECVDDIASLRLEIEELRKKIVEYYGGRLKVGTSRLLAKDLFLGFESSGNLRLFEYNGQSSVIFYSGESVDITDFVMKLFIGFLTSVNIASLTIYIMDAKFGAPRFSPFTQEDLSEAIHICSTKEQCSSVLSKMHEVLEERNKSILSYSSNIENFNKEMLEKNSLTKEYIILLIQDSNEAILNNPKFEQVLATGPDVGIVPIIFISDSWYKSVLKEEIDASDTCYSLLKSIKQNWFVYSPKQDSLLKRDDSFISINLKRLESISKKD